MRDLYSTDLAGAAYLARGEDCGWDDDRPTAADLQEGQPPCPECGEQEWDGRDCPTCGFEYDPEYHR